MKKSFVFDTETYVNYFAARFRDIESGEISSWQMMSGGKIDRKSLSDFVRSNLIVGFNSANFDLPVLFGAIHGLSTESIKDIANDVIVGGLKPWDVEKKYGFKIPRGKDIDHIDLIEVAPGQASLKIYNGRLHGKKMQDLPFHHDAVLTKAEAEETFTYCGNDLESTLILFESLSAQIALRKKMSKEYGIDLRSKSDAQVAEAVIKKEVSELLGRDIVKSDLSSGGGYNYSVPKFISFVSENLRDVLEVIRSTKFSLGNNGAIILPEALSDANIKIGNSVYRMGIGGLHSSESSITHRADKDHVLLDRDVASYYPAIILGQNLAPVQMGSAFQKVYRSIVERRLEAKRLGDKVVAESLKITINGSFGKFGNKWSALYSPQLLIQTTITGQLALLMMIEELELNGVEVVSANTDGVVMRCNKSNISVMDSVVAWWEKKTGFTTEMTEYAAIYCRDVNNYIAVKPDGSVKKKGFFADTALSKNPQNEICSEAVSKFLVDGTPTSKTIRECKDIRKFVTVRTVNGGAIWGDPAKVDPVKNYLGKAIRWYYSTEVDGYIHYGKPNKTGNHNKVPRSERARPLMELPNKFPEDVDYTWYARECRSMLEDLGYYGGIV